MDVQVSMQGSMHTLSKRWRVVLRCSSLGCIPDHTAGLGVCMKVTGGDQIGFEVTNIYWLQCAMLHVTLSGCSLTASFL